MAIITLTANTNYSALSVANGDTIELDGFALTFDVNPVEIGVTVQTAGKAGTVILGVPSTFDFTGWAFNAGAGPLLATIASGKTVGGNWTGGSTGNARAIGTNSGVILGNVTGGSGLFAHGVLNNSGEIYGEARGSATNANAHGVASNNARIFGDVFGGTGVVSQGINTNAGWILGGIYDSTGRAVLSVTSGILLVNGPTVEATLPTSLVRLYSVGTLNPLAVVDLATEVITLTTGGVGASFPPIGPGGLVY